jgi:prevent-host-death family protein
METVGAYEAKTHLPRLLADVAHGRSVTITKHGVAVARLVPAASGASEGVEVIAELKRARIGVTLGDNELRDLVEEGRR